MTNPSILVVFHSGEGQTRKVTDRIAGQLRAGGATVEVADAADAPAPDSFDAVVAGDSIHAGRHAALLAGWLHQYAATLNTMRVAVFQVSLTSANDDDEHTTTARGLLDQLLDDTGVDPDLVGLFAGALKYTQYGWIKRRLLARIVAKEGGDTDTSRDYEYTDWDAVDHFAADVLALAEMTG